MKFFPRHSQPRRNQRSLLVGRRRRVTTNPTLVSKEGNIDFHTRVREIAEVVNGPVSAEAVSLEKAKLIEEAKVIAKIHPHVVVKVPLCPDGLGAVKELSALDIKTNVTLVFSPESGDTRRGGRRDLRQPVSSDASTTSARTA